MDLMPDESTLALATLSCLSNIPDEFDRESNEKAAFPDEPRSSLYHIIDLARTGSEILRCS